MGIMPSGNKCIAGYIEALLFTLLVLLLQEDNHVYDIVATEYGALVDASGESLAGQIESLRLPETRWSKPVTHAMQDEPKGPASGDHQVIMSHLYPSWHALHADASVPFPCSGATWYRIVCGICLSSWAPLMQPLLRGVQPSPLCHGNCVM